MRYCGIWDDYKRLQPQHWHGMEFLHVYSSFRSPVMWDWHGGLRPPCSGDTIDGYWPIEAMGVVRDKQELGVAEVDEENGAW